MGRNKRGHPGEEKTKKKKRLRGERFLEAGDTTTVRVLKKYPEEFESARSGTQVRRKAGRIFGKAAKLALPSAPPNGRYVVKPSKEQRQSLPDDHPDVFCVRADEVVPLRAQHEILMAWDRLQEQEITYQHQNDKNHSTSRKSTAEPASTPALHCGVWNHSSQKPRITSDTRQPNPEARKCLQDLLELIKIHIAPIIERLTANYSPSLLEKQQRAYRYVQANVEDPLDQFGCVDFGGAFFTVALKEGSSDQLHVDFHDHAYSLTWLIPFGEWVGGDFIAPQIGERVPVGPGQVLGAMTRKLIHAGSCITSGRRLVLTCFTDMTLISKSTE